MPSHLPDFEYLTPTTIEDACSLLEQHGSKAKLLAGGTDLLVDMKERKKVPQYLIGLKNSPILTLLTTLQSRD